MNTRKTRITMVGPLPPPVGGASVLFAETLAALLSRQDFETSYVETWKPQQPLIKKMTELIRVAIQLLGQLPNTDLCIFWSSQHGVTVFGPLMCLLCGVFQKPWILRRFGQSYADHFESLSAWTRKLTGWIYNCADLVLLETRLSVKYFQKIFPEANIDWHPNYRKRTANQKPDRKHCRNFVFLGRVSEEKGLNTLLGAAGKFPQGRITVDVYGPLEMDLPAAAFQEFQNVNYKGQVSPDEVPGILQNYDALILPTFYENEGYPGVIIEAYMAGIPVIASRWLAIPEIVDETSGILVPIKDVGKLFQAMREMIESPLYYQELLGGVKRKQELFSRENGVHLLLEYMNSVLENPGCLQ